MSEETRVRVILLMAVAVYAAGVRSAWRHAGPGRAITGREIASFLLATVVAALALASPLDTMADGLLSAHMGQHVLLTTVVPPLIVLGAPQLACLWVLPLSWRRRLTAGAWHRRWMIGIWHALTKPTCAVMLTSAALWVWHLPRLFTWALSNDGVHAVEHMSFVATPILLWWSILHPRATRAHGYLVGIGLLFVTMMQGGALGAIMTLSRGVWYPAQETATTAWGITPIEDQQVAGLIMWVGGGVLNLVAMGVLFLCWMRAAASHGRAVAGTTGTVLLALSAGGCTQPKTLSRVAGNVEHGRLVVAASGCGSCHTIASIVGANGHVAAPLAGIANRTLIAGELVNSPENMLRWLRDPPAVDSTTAMPNVRLSDADARDVVAYLYTLR